MNSGKVNLKNDISIRFCGIGGMGVILVSVILGKAAIYDNKNATQTQSYGAEQRGSKVKSDVIISEKDRIDYPVIEKADVLVALSQNAFDSYISETKKDVIILINSDLVQVKNRIINNLYKIPATKIATELNNKRVINFVMLGYLIKILKIVSIKSIQKSIYETFSKQISDQNYQAFQKGFNYQ